MKIDRTGTYLFKPLDYGVDQTKSGYPTFNVQAKAVKYYDAESGEWIDWEEYDVEVPIYLCLFGVGKKSKEIEPTLNHQQVMKIFDWDGESFVKLASGDYSELLFQGRVVDNDPEYADRNPFTVAFVDVADANPISGIKKLDADKLKDLDAKFAIATKKSAKPKTAAAAPKSPPKTPPKTAAKPATKEPAIEESVTEPGVEQHKPTPEEKKAALLAKSKKNLEAAKNKKATPAPPARSKPKTDPPKDDSPTGTCTKQEAWETIVELKAKEVDDKKLGEVWNATIDEVAGEGVDNKNVTEEQWFEIKEKVLNQVGIF